MNTTPTTTVPQRRLHPSTKWLLVSFATGMAITVSLRVLRGTGVLPEEAIPASILHVGPLLGVILLVGNIIVTEAWFYLAERTGNTEILRFAAQSVNWADVFFTVPGIYLIVISGLLLTGQLDDHPGWLLGTEISLISAGVVWFLLLVPMQNRLALRAAENRLDAGFTTILHRWYWLGITATALTLAAAAFVIFQPGP